MFDFVQFFVVNDSNINVVNYILHEVHRNRIKQRLAIYRNLNLSISQSIAYEYVVCLQISPSLLPMLGENIRSNTVIADTQI